MDDPVLVRLLERLGDLARDRQRVVEWHGPARDQRSASSGPSTSSMTRALNAVGLFQAVDRGRCSDD